MPHDTARETERLPLFDHPPVLHNGTASSREGASVAAERARSQRALVLAFIRRHPDGVIARDVAEYLETEPGNVTSTLKTLENDGLIYRKGDRRKAPVSGVRCYVYRASEAVS